MIEKIISGGQTGADQGGLEAGRDLGLVTGGWAPRGWRTEDGPLPTLAKFGLREFPSFKYPPRTKQNIRDSDATVIFGDVREPGSRLTLSLCIQQGKPYIHLSDCCADAAIPGFRQWLFTHNVRVLNVAGNRESKNPGLQQRVREFLVESLRHA